MQQNLSDLLSAIQEVMDNLADAEETHDENGQIFSDLDKLRTEALRALLTQRLLEKGLHLCPACQTDNISPMVKAETDQDEYRGTARLTLFCCKCGLEWTEEYQFSHVVNVIPTNEESKKILKELYPNLLD